MRKLPFYVCAAALFTFGTMTNPTYAATANTCNPLSGGKTIVIGGGNLGNLQTVLGNLGGNSSYTNSLTGGNGFNNSNNWLGGNGNSSCSNGWNGGNGNRFNSNVWLGGNGNCLDSNRLLGGSGNNSCSDSWLGGNGNNSCSDSWLGGSGNNFCQDSWLGGGNDCLGGWIPGGSIGGGCQDPEPDRPDVPDTPDQPDTPDVPDTPDQPDTPDVPNTPNKPSVPDKPNTPNVPSRPVNPGTPSVPDTELPGNSSTQDAYAQQVVNLVNEERVKAGLSALTIHTSAESAALVRAKEIERSFSHTRPDGSSFYTVLTTAGIRYQSAGENIAYGQSSPQEVMNAWMNSSGHRANILNGNFTSIAVAHYQNASGVHYWVQLFLK